MNARLDGNKYNFKKFQSKLKLEKMDLKQEWKLQIVKFSHRSYTL